MKKIKTIGVWLGILSLLSAFGISNASAHGKAKIHTELGTISGIAGKTTHQYLGIPYAQAPVNEFRWQPPQPLASLPENFSATAFGANCPQVNSLFGDASLNEDCLFLNVYQPSYAKLSKHKLPVMVWIHGGSLYRGAAKYYDPSQMAALGVIVVTINYRLGALGFMAHPNLSANSNNGTSGNYGLMDQQAALQWVQQNISAFGGDANNVTIFGESAGGLSVHAHLVSPASAGLFHKAVVQSGAYAMTQPALEDWEMLGMGIMDAAGCPDQSLECMHALPVENILANQTATAFGWLPNVDGQLMPTTVLGALATGQFNQVPVMQGTTADEYTLFAAATYDLTGNPIQEDTYLEAITDLGFPLEAANLIAAYYPSSNYISPGAAFSAMATDFIFSCNSQTALQLLSQFVPTYGYEFNDPNAPNTLLPPVSFPYGSAHGSEIQYLMESYGPSEFTQEQKRLSYKMMFYWTNFARFGNPNWFFYNTWPEYNAATGEMISLQPPKPVVINDFNESHQCDFWKQVLGR